MTKKTDHVSLSNKLDEEIEEASSHILSNAIVDNRVRKVGHCLSESIELDADLSIVSAYFTIYAYEALKDVLDGVNHVRFLYGEPAATSSIDPDGHEPTFFNLTKDAEIELQQQLSQKKIARECIEWIKQKVDIRSIKRSNFLHGKLYHILTSDESIALIGSSNFTKSGLGYGKRPNIELNLKVGISQDRESLFNWFNELWNDKFYTQDVKQEVLDALNRLLQPSSPEFIYYKSLFHIFKDQLDKHEKARDTLDGVQLSDTQIWNSLYSFQRHGATSAINKLLEHNGCILADSVGLGKTWTALAVIKYFELNHNVRVLVLCPKRLENNWTRYQSQTAQVNNPFLEDRLNYTVLAHTDLSRYEGHSGQIDLRTFDWSSFGLVVIDESHNFRNVSPDQKDGAGNVIRHSRYNRLLEEVIKSGGPTRLLMLSATPVNTSLRDLRNQIYLITEKSEDVFKDTLGISNLQNMFKVAQTAFEQWQEQKQKSKSTLLDSLGGDLLALLDAVTLARSRKHIKVYYEKDMQEIGQFPERLPPQNFSPATDSLGEFSYEELWDRLEDFKLALYTPSYYLTDEKELQKLDEEKEVRNFDQRDRERALVGMMRVNLLKRLESSVEAFRLTTARILEKIDGIIRTIQDYRVKSDYDLTHEHAPFDDEEDEEFVVGTKLRYHVRDLDIDAWESDLLEDRVMLNVLHKKAALVTVNRDEKLTTLLAILKDKIKRASTNFDSYANKKVLVFSAFADTARYLYKNIEPWITETFGLHTALLTGGDNNQSSTGATDFINILEQFSPEGQLVQIENDEIDVLIATDCISEGQNLHDCDTVVNYDIHWNPVRITQRFGRIDRLGSQNKTVSMINFWPSEKLEDYLNLKYRVEARAALADVCATGVDDLLKPNESTDSLEGAEVDLFYRDKQLRRMRDEILDMEELEENLTMSDFTLDNFIADILQYLQKNRKALEEAPLGLYSIVPTTETSSQDTNVSRGVLFCLRNTTIDVPQGMRQLSPYYVIYVGEDGSIMSSILQVKKSLDLFRSLVFESSDCSITNKKLEDVFNETTKHGNDMNPYSGFLKDALNYVQQTFQNQEKKLLKNRRDAIITWKESLSDDWELVTWLVVLDKEIMQQNVS